MGTLKAVSVRDFLIRCMASFFFLGYCPVAPGTCGTLAGLGLFLLLPQGILFQSLYIGVLFLVGVWVSTRAEGLFGKTDSPRIVIDEVLGFFITVFALGPLSWWALAIAVVVNRIFDIAKPFGIAQSQGAPKGWGVMLDDVAAGIYSNLVLRVFMIFISVR